MLDSIIFDLDGTLIDSRTQVHHAWSRQVELLTGRPWEISDKDFTALFGQPMDYIAKFLFPDAPDQETQLRMADMCYRAENEWLQTHPVQVFPEVRETLTRLSRDISLYIVSNCQSGYIQAVLEPQDLLRYFRGWLCFGDTGTSKGKTIHQLMLQYDLHNTMYVGDTQGDEDACRLAEVPFIYAAWGFGQAAHPNRTIVRMSDLINFCAGEEAL